MNHPTRGLLYADSFLAVVAQGYHIARALPVAELDLWPARHDQRHRVAIPSLPEA